LGRIAWPPGTRTALADVLAHAFDQAFWVAFALMAIAIAPALFLPRAAKRTQRA
jgi:hypothetical protein